MPTKHKRPRVPSESGNKPRSTRHKVAGGRAPDRGAASLEHAEDALRENTQRFRQLAENIREVFWISDVKADRIIYVSPAYERVWGRTCESLYQDRRSFLEAVHPDDRPRLVKAYENQLRSRVAFRQEYRIVRPDGTVRWIWDRGFRVRNEKGQVYRLVGIAEDVTERREAEEALRRSEERWRAVFENSGVGIALTGPDGVFTAVNRAYQEMVGYTEKELRARTFLDITYEEDRPANQALAKELWGSKLRQFQFEKRYRRKDGKVIWVRNTVSLTPRTETVPRFAMAVVEDITERKRAEESLRQSEDRYRDLVEHSQDLLCTHNLHGQLLSVNRAAAEALGYEPDELLRRLLPELLALEVREEFPEYLSAIRRDGVVRGLMLILTRSGERRIWEYHNTLRVEGVPEPIVRGKAHDVTERVQAQRTIHSLLRISEKLNSTLDVDALMNSLILEAIRLTDSEIGWSGLATQRGMVCSSCVRGSEVIPFEYCWPPGVGWPGWVLTHKVPYVCIDADADAVIVPAIRQRWGVKSGVDAPILDAQGEVIGFFEVNNKPGGAYTDSDVEKMVAVSRIASVALQNALRYQQLQKADDSLRRLSTQLLHAQEEERRRIARELHDATAQSLAALAINLGVVETSSRGLKPPARHALADSFALVESCTREIRTIAYLMHPPLLRELGLASALRWYVRGFIERSGIRVKLEMPPTLGEVPDDVALALYRVVQEGLANVHRHSGSRRAIIRLARSARAIRLRIEDSGRGISRGDGPRSPGDRASEPVPGVGLAGMRERIRQLGGGLEVHSGKARQAGRKGTRLTVVLPLKKRNPAGPAHDDRKT
jgi:PAS domain S-box-containing protein